MPRQSCRSTSGKSASIDGRQFVRLTFPIMFYYDESMDLDVDQDKRSETHGDCLYIYNFESGESKLLLRPPAGAGQDNNRFNIWGFSPAPIKAR